MHQNFFLLEWLKVLLLYYTSQTYSYQDYVKIDLPDLTG